MPWLTICSIRPLRRAISWVITPKYSSGASIDKRSIGSCTLPSTILVTTCGLPTVNSNPSRFIISTNTASCSSPRPCTSQVSGRSVFKTRSETFPTNSASRRPLTWRAVNLFPLLPARGEVLIPIVIEILGSSTVINGSACGFSRSASVSPKVIVSIPATAIMSPGWASIAGTRSRASVIKSSETLTRSVEPSVLIQVTDCPFLITPSLTRQRASRPRNGDESKFVTCACSGAPSWYSGAGIAEKIVSNKTSKFSLFGMPPSAGRSRDALPALADA